MTEYSAPEEVIAVGQLFADRYQVLEHVGSGAMATVYRCADLKQGNSEVALKVLSLAMAEDETIIARFQNESRYTQVLDHPNVVRVYEYGQTADQRCYITMEYIAGKTVGDFLDGESPPFTFDELLQILLDTASGLQFAHASGIIHRDLKPDNILLTDDRRAKVTDFGLAREMDSDFHLTKSGEAVGTPCYMAPEQFRGEKTDVRTDIYALGILAYELAAGIRPFPGDTYHAIATAHLLHPLPDIDRKHRVVPRWFQEFVQLCAQKEPGDRYQTMDEVVQELEYRMELRHNITGIRAGALNIIRNSLKLFGLRRGTADERSSGSSD